MNIENKICQNIHEEKKEVDFSDLRKKMHDEIDITLDEMEDDGAETRELRIREKELLREYVEKMKKQKENFQFVFETEKGSIYFVSKNGESWRFKKEEGRDDFDEQPILEKIIFISPEEKERFLEIKKSSFFEEKLIGHQFRKSEIAQGAYPLEIGIQGFRDVVFEETNESLKIIGTKTKEGIEPIFASGIHLGYQISEIFKK